MFVRTFESNSEVKRFLLAYTNFLHMHHVVYFSGQFDVKVNEPELCSSVPNRTNISKFFFFLISNKHIQFIAKALRLQ